MAADDFSEAQRSTAASGMAEARRRIEAAARDKSGELDLGGLGLTEIPAELCDPQRYDLSRVRTLWLGAPKALQKTPYSARSAEDQRKSNAVSVLPPTLFTSLPHLTSLHLDQNRIRLSPEQASLLTGVTSLNLANNGIGDEGAAHLSALTGLTSLDLSWNWIGDVGAAHLAAQLAKISN
jgi:Leucine-rich repeat (LRR) protein